MEGCFSGVKATYSGVRSAVEGRSMKAGVLLVRPEGSSLVAAQEAEQVPLVKPEMMFMTTPLQYASFPALGFRLARAEPFLLRQSLAKVLQSYPLIAGRVRDNSVLLTNEGVPFTLVEDAGLSAPARLEEWELLRFADFRRPSRVAKGLEPLMTVKLTVFRDGSAVLGMCRSHGMLDGSGAWTFIGDWAKAARGEPVPPNRMDREAVRRCFPSSSEVEQLALEVIGEPITPSWSGRLMSYVFPIMTPFFDALFLSGLKGLYRPRVFFTDAELEAVKQAASPETGAAGDGWVSTQEAVSAYLLVTLAKALLPADTQGRSVIVFLLDARRYLGLRADNAFGHGLTFIQVPVDNVHKKSLREVAVDIHDMMHHRLDLKKQWRFFTGCVEEGHNFAVFRKLMPSKKDFDLILQLNNQSKRVLPNFGAASGGAAATDVVTNAGPSLMLPAPGGVELFLNPDVFSGHGSAATAAALQRLRADLPPASAEPPSPKVADVEPRPTSPASPARRRGGA